MTFYIWSGGGLALASIGLCVWAALTGGPGPVRPAHVEAPRSRPGIATPLGPVAQWPWDQEPAHLMLAPDGVLVSAGRDPEGWMRRMLAEIDAGWYDK